MGGLEQGRYRVMSDVGQEEGGGEGGGRWGGKVRARVEEREKGKGRGRRGEEDRRFQGRKQQPGSGGWS